jgi:4,5-DOPA dioxygenase extradiol
MEKKPVLFLGHGSPMNIILENSFTESLAQLGQSIPKPKAILVVSAHWQTKGTFITVNSAPEIIYDFYGFPQELYDVSYPCPGVNMQVAEWATILKNAGVAYDQQRGLDHGAWAVLKHLYPKADVPVMQLSLDYGKAPYEHYKLAKQLAPLRQQGVLMIGSGNIVHNLREIDWNMDAKPYDWGIEFDEQVKEAILEGKHEKLITYEKMGRSALLSIPTSEHYLPMLYTLGLQTEGDEVCFSHEGFQNASMSMRCFSIGK